MGVKVYITLYWRRVCRMDVHQISFLSLIRALYRTCLLRFQMDTVEQHESGNWFQCRLPRTGGACCSSRLPTFICPPHRHTMRNSPRQVRESVCIFCVCVSRNSSGNAAHPCLPRRLMQGGLGCVLFGGAAQTVQPASQPPAVSHIWSQQASQGPDPYQVALNESFCCHIMVIFFFLRIFSVFEYLKLNMWLQINSEFCERLIFFPHVSMIQLCCLLVLK